MIYQDKISLLIGINLLLWDCRPLLKEKKKKKNLLVNSCYLISLFFEDVVRFHDTASSKNLPFFLCFSVLMDKYGICI